MAINLKKLCDSPLLLEAIADLVKSMGTSIVIQDTKGRVIFGDDSWDPRLHGSPRSRVVEPDEVDRPDAAPGEPCGSLTWPTMSG